MEGVFFPHRKENFCASFPRQGRLTQGVARHRAPQPGPRGDRILAQVPTSAPTHCSANEGSVECAVLHRVPHMQPPGVCSRDRGPLCHQQDKPSLGFMHLLQGGHKSSSSVWMATAHRHRLSKGLSTPHPIPDHRTSPQDKSAHHNLSLVPKLFDKLHLWAQGEAATCQACLPSLAHE